MPILHTCHIRTLQFRPLGRIMFWFFVSIFLLLTWIGQQPVEEPFITLSQVLCVLYFGYFLILTPLVGLLENRLLKLNW
jgi:ubiquinol-cytochrome c reductase cytochrome b subunit